MKFFGFSKEREYLPQYTYCDTVFKKRKLFFHFFNLCLQELVFTKKELCSLKSKTLFALYKEKITRLTLPQNVAKVQPLHFDAKLNMFLHTHKISHSFLLQTEQNNYAVAAALSSFLADDYTQVLISSDLLFKNFVHKSITSLKRDRIVSNEKDCIDMYLKDPGSNIKVLPFWERGKKLDDAHIQKAVDCIKQSEFKNIYLVYPKEEGFKKHIDVKVPELEGCSEYVIKIIPYSLKPILKS